MNNFSFERAPAEVEMLGSTGTTLGTPWMPATAGKHATGRATPRARGNSQKNQ
jgi:hypothetical protein